MEKEAIASFSATTFNGRNIEFIVYSDNTIRCLDLEEEKYFYRIELKPRFRLISYRYYYEYDAPAANRSGYQDLIASYNIEEALFYYLKARGMIRYCIDMAYLYDLPDKGGYDKERYGGTPYKRALKKGPILTKQKEGQFD